MPIIFYCPRCGREIRVRSAAAGQKGKCIDCGAKIVVSDFSDLQSVAPSRPVTSDTSIDSVPDIPNGFLSDIRPPAEDDETPSRPTSNADVPLQRTTR